MTGICGVIGDDDNDVDSITTGLEWSTDERQFEYDHDQVSVRCSLPTDTMQNPPASTGDEAVWFWGNLFGYSSQDGYQQLPATATDCATRVARLYERYGPTIFESLNGDFFAIVHDRSRQTVSFITDRLGTRDVYYSVTPENTIVFSSRIQSLPKHPCIEAAFDREYLYEYFTFRRAFGIKTPLVNVTMFPPAAVTTYDLEAREIHSEYYWRPHHQPIDKPFSFFVEEFIDRFRSAVNDRIPTDGNGALLLSGGADSRLLLAVLDELNHDVTAYHMAGWMSREARIAERVAITVGIEFELLRRDETYFENLLYDTPPKNNFVQRFDQAHAQGFIDKLRSKHDFVLTNHFPDMMFDKLVPKPQLSLGPLGTVTVPIETRLETIDEFLEYTTSTYTSPPPFFDLSTPLVDILAKNIERHDDGINYHGVQYESLKDVVLYRRVWPGTNGTDTFFRRSLHENITHHIPLLDTRLLNLWVNIPKRYLLRRNIVNAALTRISPELASIPHSETGVPLSRSFPHSYIETYLNKGARKVFPVDETPPLPTLGNGPWGNISEVIRNHSFVLDTIEKNEAVFQELPYLDFDAAIDYYEEHCAGKNHTRGLLTLVTFLEMPLTNKIVS